MDSVRRVGDALFSDLTHTAENATLPDGTMGTLKAHVVALLVKKGKGWAIAEARPYLFLPASPPRAAAMPSK